MTVELAKQALADEKEYQTTTGMRYSTSESRGRMFTREPLLAQSVIDQAKEIERLNADVERYRTQLTVERGNHGNTRDELEAMTSARDEACDIAMARELPECPPEIDATMERVRVLRSVGAKS